MHNLADGFSQLFITGSLIISFILIGLTTNVTTTNQNQLSQASGSVEDIEPPDTDITFISNDHAYDDYVDLPAATVETYGRPSNAQFEDQRTEERCPPLPEPTLANAKLCEARNCLKDLDCHATSPSMSAGSDVNVNQSHGDLICCFNGCVHSCLNKVDPPQAFDWLEETDINQFLVSASNNETSTPDGEDIGSTRKILSANEAPEIYALPGGCLLNSQQYENIQLFRKDRHFMACKCAGGDITCQVNPVYSN